MIDIRSINKTFHVPHEVKALVDVTTEIEQGQVVVVCGPSGSGKSTLLMDIVHRHLAQELHHAQDRPAAHDDILGINYLDKVIDIDQSPIGRAAEGGVE